MSEKVFRKSSQSSISISSFGTTPPTFHVLTNTLKKIKMKIKIIREEISIDINDRIRRLIVRHMKS